MTLEEMLACLHRLLDVDDTQDELLCDLLADANALMLAYIGREELPIALSRAQCRLAAVLYNRLGMEGESRRTEGSVTVTVDTLPEDILTLLRPFRLAGTVSL